VRLALFDRDGVLNEDTGYPHRPDQIEWIEGAFEALAELRRKGFCVAVVTNQSGVARGHFGEDDISVLHQWMAGQVEAKGGRIDAFYYCPYHPEALIDAYRADHPDRKPSPGMILRALADFGANPESCFLIGDRDVDLAAAAAAGVPAYQFTGGRLDLLVSAILDDRCGTKG
jgi:D-glycero-D-manno-heptose 1,7-bisphosphate phosphatase